MSTPVLKKSLGAALALSALLGSASVLAADVEAGKQLVMHGNNKGATACLSCHGADGAGNAAAGFPRLAGLNAGYLAKQLHDFASGSRTNMIMQPIAKALSKQDIANVTAYYASQQAPHTAAKLEPGVIDEGKKLVERGDWSKTVPACIQCHGPGAHGVGTHFPALAGQHASYIESQLNAWKQGMRKNDPDKLMEGVAARLSDSQVKAVSAYLATLKPAAH